MLESYIRKIKLLEMSENLEYYVLNQWGPNEDSYHRNKKHIFSILQELISQKSYNLALEVTLILYNSYQHDGLIYFIALALYNLGRYEEALNDWLKLIHYKRMNLNERYLKALVYEALNMPYRAIKILESLGRNYSKKNNIQLFLAKLYLQVGDRNQSFEAYYKYYQQNKQIWSEIFINFAQDKYFKLNEIYRSIDPERISCRQEIYAYALYLIEINDYLSANKWITKLLDTNSSDWQALVLQIKLNHGIGNQILLYENLDNLWPIMPILQAEILEIMPIILDRKYWSQALARYLLDLYYMHEDNFVSNLALQWYGRIKSKTVNANQMLLELDSIQDHTLKNNTLSHIYAELYAKLDYPSEMVINKYLEAIEARVNDSTILKRLVDYCMKNDKINLALDFIQRYELSIYWHRDFIKIKERYGIINKE